VTTIRVLAILLLTSFVAAPAFARNDTLDFTVESAKKLGPKDKLLDIPYYMAGQKHPAVAKDFGEARTNKATNKFNKDDDYACAIAFTSAIIQLQTRAKQLGANAVVDIKSVTKGMNLESATKYRCNLGTFTAVVGLTGTPVKLK